MSLNFSGSHTLLTYIENRVLDRITDVEQWLRQQWMDIDPHFYSSVDLRVSNFKIAPIDTNLFPGGFNNLSDRSMTQAVQATKHVIERLCANACKILIITENHTRNTFYLTHLKRLELIFTNSGLEVTLGSLADDWPEAGVTLETSENSQVFIGKIKRENGQLTVTGKPPCLVLLNNDLSGGVPEKLRNLRQQIIFPQTHLGWTTRRKSKHFTYYSQVAREFAQLTKLDSWLIDPYAEECGDIDFLSRTGEQCLAENVERLLAKVRLKYQDYDIKDEPFVVVKADAGTYGMGVMVVKSAEEVIRLNRKQRNKMARIKEGISVNDVFIQEGVPTIEQINDAAAESVVYMVDREVIGGFYRVHSSKNARENLNAPGMTFAPMAFESSCSLANPELAPNISENRLYVYGVIARLASLAAAIEGRETKPSDQLTLSDQAHMAKQRFASS